MLDIFVTWPMPLIWLMGIGLVLWWRNSSSVVLAVAAGLLILSSVPFVGKLLHVPLSYGAIRDVTRLSNSNVVGVFVPTAGSFRDVLGKWWPEEGSFKRYAAALKLARSLGVPVIVGGGSPHCSQPAEAQTVVDIVGKIGVDVIVVGKGGNSAETAEAVGLHAQAKAGGLILVTTGRHIARMRASLRRHGLNVTASTTPLWLDRGAHSSGWTWRDIVPSDDGLDLTGAAVYEYVGLALYLVSGKVRLRDL